MTDLLSQSGALFDKTLKYRYVLWRIWDTKKPVIMYIGLNPSKADAQKDDPTITRLKGLTNNLGYGGFYMLNLFTFITPYPNKLKASRNDKALKYIDLFAKKAFIVVFCWGTFKESKQRTRDVIKRFPKAYCFGVNRDLSPKHPLYLKSNTELKKYPLSISNEPTDI